MDGSSERRAWVRRACAAAVVSNCCAPEARLPRFLVLAHPSFPRYPYPGFAPAAAAVFLD